MGAQTFVEISYGKDAASAYEQAREDALYMYGHDSYNGSISTTYGFSKCYGEINGNTPWTKTKEKKAYELVDKLLNDMEKRECKVIDLGKVSNRITHHNGWHKFIFFGWGAC